jgi:hypothetical protein
MTGWPGWTNTLHLPAWNKIHPVNPVHPVVRLWPFHGFKFRNKKNAAGKSGGI